jgi:hypothetical protein
MEFVYLYLTGIVVTFAFLLWLNQREGVDVLKDPTGLDDPNTYYDQDDGAALIIGALFGSIIWPATAGIFIYYKYFDKP